MQKDWGKNSRYKANGVNIIYSWGVKKKSKSSGIEQIFKDIQIIHKRIDFQKQKYIYVYLYLYLKTPPMPKERTPEWSSLRYMLIKLLVFKEEKRNL